jgi:alcohol dehydrogenase YqhD (iron-dependent ADH family)
MENFELYNPVKIIFGPGEVSKTGEEAAKLGKKAMVVSYREHDFFADLLKSVETMLTSAGLGTMLTSAGLGVVPYYEVTANPLMGQVDAAVRLCKAEDVDLVIAVGGGSAMDVAKITAAGVQYQEDLWKMIVSRHDQEVAEPPEKALPLLMVPTLHGEILCVCRMFISEGIHRRSFTHLQSTAISNGLRCGGYDFTRHGNIS